MSILIRRRGSRFQLIRQEYSAERGRGVQRLLGSWSIGEAAVPGELLEQLTDAERERAKAWATERAAERERERTTWRRHSIERALAESAAALDADEQGVDAAEAERIVEGIRQLRLALNRARRRAARPAPTSAAGPA